MQTDPETALLDQLIESLSDVARAEPDRIPIFRTLSEDYATLSRMGEFPEHARGALGAWRDLLAGASGEVQPSRKLLDMLSTAYQRAARAGDLSPAATPSAQHPGDDTPSAGPELIADDD